MAKTIDEVITDRLEAFELVMPVKKVQYVKDEIIQHVLNYCNLTRLPKELFHLVAKMVTELAAPKPPADGEEVNPMAGVKSIKVGDVTVDLSGSSASKSAVETDSKLQDVMRDYQGQLNAFRKVKW